MSRNQPTTLVAYSLRGISSGSPRINTRKGWEGSRPWAIAFISRSETMRSAPANRGTDGDREVFDGVNALGILTPCAIPVATTTFDGDLV